VSPPEEAIPQSTGNGANYRLSAGSDAHYRLSAGNALFSVSNRNENSQPARERWAKKRTCGAQYHPFAADRRSWVLWLLCVVAAAVAVRRVTNWGALGSLLWRGAAHYVCLLSLAFIIGRAVTRESGCQGYLVGGGGLTRLMTRTQMSYLQMVFLNEAPSTRHAGPHVLDHVSLWHT
jgi:hypothetical protein